MNKLRNYKIFIGWDSREPQAYDTCVRSIRETSDTTIKEWPVPYIWKHAPTDDYNILIVPLKLKELSANYWRPHDEFASTEFSLTRFLTPFLNAYQGWALFIDSDFLFTQDVRNVFEYRDYSKAVQVVKHEYTPKDSIKMDGKQQHVYPRKNWSSCMLFNCQHPKNRIVTPETVSDVHPSYLHQFKWLNDDDIGELPLEWNFLAGEYHKPGKLPAAIHYTRGIPTMPGYESGDYADYWWKTYNGMKQESGK